MYVCHRSLGSLSVLFGQVVKGLSSGSRVFQYMAMPPSSPLKGGLTLPPHQVTGRVEFRDICFSYPTRPNQVCQVVQEPVGTSSTNLASMSLHGQLLLPCVCNTRITLRSYIVSI